MEPGLSELGTGNGGGASWEAGATAGVAAAEVVTGAVVVLSRVASVVDTALAGAEGVASAGAVMEEGGSEVGAVVAKGRAGVGVGSVVVAAVVSVMMAFPADAGTTGGLVLSTAGLETGSLSAGGVGSEGCGEAFDSSEESEDAARRPPNDMGKAEAAGPGWGTGKAGLVLDSGGLNKLPDAAPLDKSVAIESSADFWRPASKLNCAPPLAKPNPVLPKVNVAAAGLVEESLASSCPTRSSEKLPRVSPPAVLGGCGSILREVVVEVGLVASVDVFGVGDTVPRAGEVDFGVRENGSSPVWPNTNLPFPKDNLFTSFTCDIPAPCVTEAKLKPADPVVKEKPLLVLCSAELAGATDTSVLDG